MQTAMWNHLKKLMSSAVGQRPTRRRAEASRFRGHIEPLETRSMLSATIGVATFELETVRVTVVAVWESPAPKPPLMVSNSTNMLDQAPWEHLPDRSLLGGPGHGPGPALGISWKPPLGATNVPNNVVTGGNQAGFSEDLDAGNGGGHVIVGSQDPLKGTAPGGTGGGSQNVTNKALNSPNPWLPNRTFDFSFYSQSLGLASTFDSSSVGTSSSLKTYDAVFGDYSSDSLLLAANVDSKHASSMDDELDDAFDSQDKPLLVAPADESLADQTVAESLDALQRERAAIDEVLADLHDVKLRPTTARQDDATGDHENTSTVAGQSEQNQFNTAYQTQAPPRHESNGGMVLLQPNGDANSNAYDLATAYLAGVDNPVAAPLGVEATVGMYQAIDFGTGQSRPATSENVPLAQPNVARPSVSAENAPAKKSEQPS
jgi:hypothetical protein